MRTEDFNFYLPEHLIAQNPTSYRSASRLLKVNNANDTFDDVTFKDIIDFLSPNDVLILNNTKVIKARLFGHKETGGAVELLIERILDDHKAHAHIKASRSPKAGSIILINEVLELRVLGRNDDLFLVEFLSEDSIFDLLESNGHLPLPPYIAHLADKEDEARYQTVFAKHEGAIAAPTAGLHFDEALLKVISAKGITIAYITLHVGAGTFRPVKADYITEHKMHSEQYSIPEETVKAINLAKSKQGKVIAVGTTALRALESAALKGELTAGSNETNIFIYPGFKFRVVDRLITNFHLPKSTLLMLVSAFSGYTTIKNTYAYAVEHEYRFFSYGDAMLLDRLENTD
jgi:S-adenosylmethionine:tRNA ribosyltransferase-isomerase